MGKRKNKEKHSWVSSASAIIALVIFAMMALILVLWWFGQEPGPVVANNTSSPLQPELNISPPFQSESNISQPSGHMQNDTIISTQNNANFLCQKGWLLESMSYDKFGSHNVSWTRCARDSSSFITIYSMLDQGENPSLNEVLEVLMNRTQMAGGRAFKPDKNNPSDYTYTLSSVERRGSVSFLSCDGKNSFVQIEFPQSQYGSQITPIIHSIMCKLQ